MITSSLEHIKVAGVAAAVPARRVLSESYGSVLGEETVRKLIEKTGVRQCYHAHEKQTASDLAFSAAEYLMREKEISPASIGVLLFVSSCPDYSILPPTSMVLQKRLGIPQDCIVYDINLNCSGFVYGLQTAASLLLSTTARRALVLIGDTMSKNVSPYDTSRILFGDGGAAALLEKTPEAGTAMRFGLRSDGNRFTSIIVPAGGFRRPRIFDEDAVKTDEKHRSADHLHMNGLDVFNFAMRDVCRLLADFEEYFQISPRELDAVVFHQANLSILRQLTRKLKIPSEKVPISITRYGNTASASLPVAICDAFGASVENGTKNIMICGFGVGLSWGAAALALDTDAVLPVIHTDDYYSDGAMEYYRQAASEN